MSTDLQRLFDEDPLNLTSSNIDDMIAYYRAARANFNLSGSTKPKKAEKEKVESINLDDLLGGPTK